MNEQFWQVYLIHDITQVTRYFLFAGLAYLVFYVMFRQKWGHRKIQKRFPEKKQINREIKDSLISILIFSVVFVVIVLATRAGFTKLYRDTNHIGRWYFWLSIPMLILWHDTWFYWMHRLMHQPKIFKIVHKQHHLSHNPTPWTAFAFHPIEAFVEASFVFVVFIVPLHPVCIVIAVSWQMLFNIYGHLGFELMPKWMHHSMIGRLFNTSTHHNMHHRLTKGNYGLYFNFWDKLMHTNHPDYEQQFEQNANDK